MVQRVQVVHKNYNLLNLCWPFLRLNCDFDGQILQCPVVLQYTERFIQYTLYEKGRYMSATGGIFIHWSKNTRISPTYSWICFSLVFVWIWNSTVFWWRNERGHLMIFTINFLIAAKKPLTLVSFQRNAELFRACFWSGAFSSTLSWEVIVTVSCNLLLVQKAVTMMPWQKQNKWK